MKEIERIEQNIQGQLPNSPKMIITIEKVKNPEKIMDNAKEIMKIISQYAYTNNWPSDEEWKTILPQWFVESMTKKSIEEIMKNKGQWHFESWVESMYHRAWEWYSSKIEGDKIIIVLEMLNLPYIFEQFLYIFYAQEIPMSNITDEDDIYGKTKH